MKKPERESRKYPRYTKILGVSCIVREFPMEVTGEKAKLKQGESFRATSINVSEEGVLLNCDFLFPDRTIIDITVHDDAVAAEKFTIKGRIEWTKRNAYKIFGRYSAGVHIVEGQKEHIKKLIEHFSE